MSKLNLKIIVGVMSVMVISLSFSFYLFYRFHKGELIERLKNSTSIQSELIVKSLESAMLIRYPYLLSEVIENLARQKDVNNIMVLNKNGIVKISTDKEMKEKRMDRKEESCQICHVYSPGIRSKSVVFKNTKGETVLRNVSPIFNVEKCHFCHSPDDRINGVLIIDYSLDEVNRQLSKNIKKLFLWSLFSGLLMMVVIILIMNRFVIRRIKEFLVTVDKINRGILSARIQIRGNDEITKLTEHFNRMTENLEKSMKEVIQNRDFLKWILESIDDGVVVVDKNFKVLAANMSFTKLFMKNEEGPVTDKLCYDLTSEAEIPCKKAQICPAQKTFEKGISNKALINYVHNGRTLFYEIYSSPVRGGKEDVIMCVEVWRDITERKSFEAKLIHTEKLASLGLLAAGFSHELNTPLASIRTCIDGISRKLKNENKTGASIDNLSEYLELIKKEISRCKEITDRLRFISYKSKFDRTVVDINLCLKNVVQIIDFEARKHNTSIILNLNEKLPPITGDLSQLHQVFMNIIMNSIYADSHSINVSTFVSDSNLCITIEDDGYGINEEDKRYLFEPFFTKKPPGEGTGLGLFISYNIVKQHGGEITILSEVNKGTKVNISFPIQKL